MAAVNKSSNRIYSEEDLQFGKPDRQLIEARWESLAASTPSKWWNRSNATIYVLGATIVCYQSRLHQAFDIPVGNSSHVSLRGATLTVQYSPADELTVFYDGPVSKKLTLAPGASQTLDLAPGEFHVAGLVSAADVLPFYGQETYAGSASCSATFYIAS